MPKSYQLPELEQIKIWKSQADSKNKVLALLVAGDSCSGKNSRLNIISKELKLAKIITSTTRPIRKGEVNGVDYHFVDQKDFLQNKDKYLETTNYGFNYYGTLLSEFTSKINNDQDCYIVLDVTGIANIKNELELKYSDKFLVKTIYYEISQDTFFKRIKLRDKNMSDEYYQQRWGENKIAHVKIKDNPMIDLIVDCNSEIKKFKPKDDKAK